VAPTRQRSARESGAAIIEFALAFPILILLMMGVIDFGVNYGNKVQTSHAAREGARAGSVGRVGTDGSCFIAGTPIDVHTRELICLTKARTHMDPQDVRVRISYMDGDGAYTNDFAEAVRQQNRYSMMVCVSTKAYSLSGLLAPIFDGKYHHARAVIKTGTTPWSTTAASGATVYSYVGQFAETPFANGAAVDSWSWCRSDDPGKDVSL
jgi:TadE-like protein